MLSYLSVSDSSNLRLREGPGTEGGWLEFVDMLCKTLDPEEVCGEKLHSAFRLSLTLSLSLSHSLSLCLSLCLDRKSVV